MDNFLDKKIGRLAFAVNFILYIPVLMIIKSMGKFIPDSGEGSGLVIFIYFLLCLLVVSWAVLATIFRLHDIGRSRNWAWLFFVPFGNLVLAVWCIFCKSNSYHKD